MVNKPLKKNKEFTNPELQKPDNFVIEKTEHPATTPDVINQPISPEQPPTQPEQTPENIETQQPQETTLETQSSNESIDNKIDTLKNKLLKKKKKVQMPQVKDELTLRIEKVMEDGIADAYRELTPVQQQEFKIKGEETAYKIRELLKKTRIKIKDIFKLLYEWLRMLPGINKFFLEQEAKIKADKIIAIKDVSDINKS